MKEGFQEREKKMKKCFEKDGWRRMRIKKDEEDRRKKKGGDIDWKTTFLSRTICLKTGNEMDKRWSWDRSKKRRRENAFTLFPPCHCSFRSFSCCKQYEPRAFCLNYDQKVETSKKGGCKKIVSQRMSSTLILSHPFVLSHPLTLSDGNRVEEKTILLQCKIFFPHPLVNRVQNVKLWKYKKRTFLVHFQHFMLFKTILE